MLKRKRSCRIICSSTNGTGNPDSNSGLLAYSGRLWYDVVEVIDMETKDVILALRTKSGMSQETLAERVFVTRQAVSRWETGETVPNTETLKLLSGVFDVSINTLLGSPRNLICQCCGMPLEDTILSREKDGALNEHYCKWCYHDGEFAYQSVEELTEFLVGHMTQYPPEQMREYLSGMLPTLAHWKQPASE